MSATPHAGRPPCGQVRVATFTHMRRLLIAWSLATLGVPVAAHGQLGFLRSPQQAEGGTAQRPSPDENESVEPASPRAAVRAYLRAARKGDWVAAAKWLGTPVGEGERLPELAQELKAVLDRHIDIRLDRISARAGGDTADGLPPDREQIGEIPSPDLGAQSVRLIRVDRPSPHWVFSPKTIEHVDQWYDELEDKWLRDRLPAWLFLAGPGQVLWWQWMTLLVLIPVALVLARLLRPLLGVVLRAVPAWRGAVGVEMLNQLGTPTLFLVAVLLYRLAISPLLLLAVSNRVIGTVIGAIVIAAVTWWTLRAVTLVAALLPASEWAGGRSGVRSALALGSRVAKVLIVVIAAIGLFADLGYPVGTLLAGLGIGGVAVALGAQKTLEHFFGSVSIGVDQPIRVGDWVKIDDFEGEVENIGLRSTRIRTLERSVISLPNGKLAEMRTENFADRDRVRFHAALNIQYGATPAQLRAVRDALEAALRANGQVWQDRVIVRLRELGASAITLELMAWFVTRDVDEFRIWREQLLLTILERCAANGVRLAFPTQVIVLRRDDSDVGAAGAAVARGATPPSVAASPSRD